MNWVYEAMSDDRLKLVSENGQYELIIWKDEKVYVGVYAIANPMSKKIVTWECGFDHIGGMTVERAIFQANEYIATMGTCSVCGKHKRLDAHICHECWGKLEDAQPQPPGLADMGWDEACAEQQDIADEKRRLFMEEGQLEMESCMEDLEREEHHAMSMQEASDAEFMGTRE